MSLSDKISRNDSSRSFCVDKDVPTRHFHDVSASRQRTDEDEKSGAVVRRSRRVTSSYRDDCSVMSQKPRQVQKTANNGLALQNDPQHRNSARKQRQASGQPKVSLGFLVTSISKSGKAETKIKSLSEMKEETRLRQVQRKRLQNDKTKVVPCTNLHCKYNNRRKAPHCDGKLQKLQRFTANVTDTASKSKVVQSPAPSSSIVKKITNFENSPDLQPTETVIKTSTSTGTNATYSKSKLEGGSSIGTKEVLSPKGECKKLDIAEFHESEPAPTNPSTEPLQNENSCNTSAEQLEVQVHSGSSIIYHVEGNICNIQPSEDSLIPLFVEVEPAEEISEKHNSNSNAILEFSKEEEEQKQHNQQCLVLTMESETIQEIPILQQTLLETEDNCKTIVGASVPSRDELLFIFRQVLAFTPQEFYLSKSNGFPDIPEKSIKNPIDMLSVLELVESGEIGTLKSLERNLTMVFGPPLFLLSTQHCLSKMASSALLALRSVFHEYESNPSLLHERFLRFSGRGFVVLYPDLDSSYPERQTRAASPDIADFTCKVKRRKATQSTQEGYSLT